MATNIHIWLCSTILLKICICCFGNWMEYIPDIGNIDAHTISIPYQQIYVHSQKERLRLNHTFTCNKRDKHLVVWTDNKEGHNNFNKKHVIIAEGDSNECFDEGQIIICIQLSNSFEFLQQKTYSHSESEWISTLEVINYSNDTSLLFWFIISKIPQGCELDQCNQYVVKSKFELIYVQIMMNYTTTPLSVDQFVQFFNETYPYCFPLGATLPIFLDNLAASHPKKTQSNWMTIKYRCFRDGKEIAFNIRSGVKILFKPIVDVCPPNNSCMSIVIYLCLDVNDVNNFDTYHHGSYQCQFKFLDRNRKVVIHLHSNIINFVADDVKTALEQYPKIINSRINLPTNFYMERVGTNMMEMNKTVDNFTDEVKDFVNIHYAIVFLILDIVIVVILSVCKAYCDNKRESNYRKSLAYLPILHAVRKEKHQLTWDIYLSYSVQDKPFIHTEIIPFLEALGYSIYISGRDHDFGDLEISSAATGMCRSRKTVAVFSPHYIRDRWCVGHAFAMAYNRVIRKEEPRDSLVIIRHKACRLPAQLTGRHFVDWTKLNNSNRGDLQKELISKLGKPMKKGPNMKMNQQQGWHKKRKGKKGSGKKWT